MKRRSLIAAAAAAPFAFIPFRNALAQPAGPVVRVGDAIGDPYAEGYFANDGGFFRKSGLNVDFQSFASGTPVAQGVVTGNLEIGIVTPLAIATAFTHGVDLAIIAPGCVNTGKAPSGFLIVGKSSPLNTLQDFEGKPIAVASLRTLHELMLRAWFDKNHVDQSKLSLVEMTFSEMAPAIERGTVAGAMQVEPLTSGLVNAGSVRVIPGPATAIAADILGSAWFCMRDYARKNPDVVRRFAGLMVDVARWANAHKSETGDIEARVGKLEPDVVRRMARVSYAETIRTEQLQPVLDAGAKFGILSRHVAATELIFR